MSMGGCRIDERYMCVITKHTVSNMIPITPLPLAVNPMKQSGTKAWFLGLKQRLRKMPL
jgi:hypothetical protein